MENVMSKETRRIGKRTLAMFMAIVMCLSLLPVNALARNKDVELVVGETVKLSGIASSDNGEHEWSVEDESIVSVEDGYVTGLKAGKTTVTHGYYVEIEEEIEEVAEAPVEDPSEDPAEEPEVPAEEPEVPAE